MQHRSLHRSPKQKAEQLELPGELTTALRSIAESLKTPLLPPPPQKQPWTVPAKLYLKMADAVRYSGLTKKELLEEIEAGRLEVKRRVRGKGIQYLVRRRSLERLVWK